MVQQWAFVISDEPAVRIAYVIVIKHNVSSGSSQSAHIPVMDTRALKFSLRS